MVQDAWLRWRDVDHGSVDDARAYLTRVTTRLAIDRLRRERRRRETYVGPWLPEPVAPDLDASERAELADSVEMALLVVLETLSPLERAVFVLRERSASRTRRSPGSSTAASRRFASWPIAPGDTSTNAAHASTPTGGRAER